jgi:hypothetical protein
MGLSEGTTLNHDGSRGIGKCCATRHDPIAPTVDSGTGRGQSTSRRQTVKVIGERWRVYRD